MIVTLHTQGDRIIVGDVQESVHYIKYKSQENQVRAAPARVHRVPAAFGQPSAPGRA